MEISSTTNMSALMASAQAAASGQQTNPLEASIDAAVAKLSGISVDTLNSDLASGQTLSAIASANGVSSSSLVSTISSVLSANPPLGAPAASSDQLKSIATDIANGIAPTPPNGPPPSFGSSSGGTSEDTSSSQTGSTATKLTDLASVLGMDSSSLKTALTSGTTLAELLRQSSAAAGTSTTVADSTASVGVLYDNSL